MENKIILGWLQEPLKLSGANVQLEFSSFSWEFKNSLLFVSQDLPVNSTKIQLWKAEQTLPIILFFTLTVRLFFWFLLPEAGIIWFDGITGVSQVHMESSGSNMIQLNFQEKNLILRLFLFHFYHRLAV